MPSSSNVFRALLLTAMSTTLLAFSNLSLAGSSPIDHKVLKPSAAPLAEVQFISASDGARLAFRLYQPRDPQGVLLFYHSAGLHSAIGYPSLAYELARNHRMAVYMADLRGHGESSGDRGDSPSVDMFWEDIDTMLEYLHFEHHDLPIYLGGHATGAALVLNYISENPKVPVDGMVFLSPNFGNDANLNRRTDPAFMEGDATTGIYNKATFGLACKHCVALSLNYPHSLKVNYPGVVTELSQTTLQAMTPENTALQIRKIRKPFVVFTGSKDELVQGGRTKMFIKRNGRDPWLQKNELLKNETHLSILLNAASHVGNWLNGHSQQLAQN
ncbi:alpha/beta hydrolase [Hahella ganghwensis]|uniref:alpha/beta hydrolase n=1 Tax=Hahella ganghwensis TaxID=286420 RepID=UPI00036EC839|nr:alpha/beta fold hydrolase [Hahella ganghwensis]